MLKREKQDYTLHRVNLYHGVMSANLSQHINISGGITRAFLQKLATVKKEKINSQQSIKISDYLNTVKVITEFLPCGALTPT
jgi:hypothetical protein